MSRQYDSYLAEHRENVYKGYLWIMSNIDEKTLDDILPELRVADVMMALKLHDASKEFDDEYSAYDRYFYGRGKGDEEVSRAFNVAWLKHIHRNSHHWQHWVLIQDDGDIDEIEEEGVRYNNKMLALDMPDDDILEMICDWWSFSWREGNLREIFDWYADHVRKIVLSSETQSKVEKLLNVIEEKLDELENLEELDTVDREGDRDIDDPIEGTVIVEE